jgi:hypothetical protein
MECSEVVGAELVGGTDLGSGRDRWIECNRDERRGARRRAVARAGPAPPSGAGRVRSTSGGDTSKQSASRDGGWHRRGRRRRSPSERGARSVEQACGAGWVRDERMRMGPRMSG